MPCCVFLQVTCVYTVPEGLQTSSVLAASTRILSASSESGAFSRAFFAAASYPSVAACAVRPECSTIRNVVIPIPYQAVRPGKGVPVKANKIEALMRG